MTSADDRLQLFENLSKLPPQNFEGLLFSLKPPTGIVPSSVAPQRSRVAALLEWAESPMGCGTKGVQICLEKLLEMNKSQPSGKFQDYLDLVCQDHRNYWQHHTFIDEIDDSTWFEFSLDTKVKTQQPRENESQQDSKLPQTKRKPILQAIQELGEQSLLIFGSSGSGKSTLLSRLFYESALKAQKGMSNLVPVLIELKSYETAGKDGEIEGLILNSLQSYDPDLGKEDLKQIRKEKRLALFIDGFNELPIEGAKPKIKQYCKNVRTVATSRNKDDWQELPKRLEIQPLTYDEVIDFFKERLPGTSQEKLKELGNRVRDFGDTPLMVWMLYCIFNTNKEIPETRGETYRRFTTLYLERSKEGIDLPESRTLLGKLAFEMMQFGNTGNSTDFRLELSEIDAQNILGLEQTLKLLRNCHLLKSHGKPGNRRIKFCHQSLQEYYAAEELLLKFQKKHLECTDAQHFQYFYLNQRKWTESIALMLSILENPDSVDDIIQLACSVDLVLGARLAGATRQEIQNNFLNLFSTDEHPKWLRIHLLSEINSPKVSEMLLGFLGDSDIEICKRAVWASRKLKPLFAKPVIFKALKNGNSSVRETAARTLSTLDKNEAFEIARDILYKEPEADVRMAVVLNVLGKDSSEESIIELLRTAQDSDHNVATMASYQVEEMMPEIFPMLIKFLRCREKAVCKSAIEVLARVGDETCLVSLSEAKISKDDDIYVEACFAIREIEERMHSASLKQKAAMRQQQINYWISYLNSKEPIPRGNAVYHLSSLLAKKYATEMVLQARLDPHEYVRGHAIGVLEKLLREDAIPLLIEALDDPHHHVRGIAAEQLTNKRFIRQISIPEITISKLISHVSLSSGISVVKDNIGALISLCAVMPRAIARK